MRNSLVSVIMPSYNTAKYIVDSINSVLAQTYQDWELIIVDDHSTDNTMEILQQYTDKRIRIFSNRQNSGVAVTRNRAIEKAKGRWLAFLDSDDLWCPDKLEKQIAFMERNGHSVSYTKYEKIDELGKPLKIEVSGPMVVDSDKIILCNWLGCLTVVYDADKIGKVLSSNVRSRNDYSMWLQVVKKDSCYLLNENLAKYRKHKFGSISSHGTIHLIKAQYNLYRRGFEKSCIESVVRTMLNVICVIYKKKFFERKVA